MRKMRLTLFLVIANIAVLFCILKLEFADETVEKSQRPLVEITRLEVHGKNLPKPRVVVFEKNKWEITSPIKWSANAFAVNRILRNLEFLDGEIGFAAEDLAMRGQSLRDYGLDDPICTFNYGNGKLMYSLKIGNSSSVGDKVYMLDSLENRVIVADNQLADALMVDIDRLRSQSVISIPKFEISSIALRLPVKDPKTQAKSTWRRVGLAKDLDGSWNFEAPFVADASNKAVEAFLSQISSAYIKSFDDISDVEAGLDPVSFPVNISLDSTNKSQTLFLGHLNKENNTIYAKLADNPTIFTLDSKAFENLDNIQEDLRTRDIMKFSEYACDYIEISSPDSVAMLKKLSNNTWNVSGSKGGKLSEATTADLTLINSLLASLNNTIARAFVSDLENDDLARYGLVEPRLKISLGFDNATKKTLLIGDSYKQGVVTLYYAKVEGEASIYAISAELINKYTSHALEYRSKLLYSLPENSKILAIDVSNLKTKDNLLSAKSVDGNFDAYIATLLPKDRQFFDNILTYAKTFYVEKYITAKHEGEALIYNGEDCPLLYEIKITISMPGTGGDEIVEEKILLTDRYGADLQFGLYKAESFSLVASLINSLYNLGVSSMPTQDKE